MARTLQQLKESIEQMIEEQGKDAPVAAFLFTQHDVFHYDEETLEENVYPMNVIEEVLNNVEEDDHIIEQVFERIGMELGNVTV